MAQGEELQGTAGEGTRLPQPLRTELGQQPTGARQPQRALHLLEGPRPLTGHTPSSHLPKTWNDAGRVSLPRLPAAPPQSSPHHVTEWREQSTRRCPKSVGLTLREATFLYLRCTPALSTRQGLASAQAHCGPWSQEETPPPRVPASLLSGVALDCAQAPGTHGCVDLRVVGSVRDPVFLQRARRGVTGFREKVE